MINSKWKVLICESCNSAVPRDHLRLHLQKHHVPLKGVSDEQLQELYEHNDLHLDIGSELQNQSAAIEPVAGLKIFDGWHCQVRDCHYAAKERRTIQNHISKNHKGNTLGQDCGFSPTTF